MAFRGPKLSKKDSHDIHENSTFPMISQHGPQQTRRPRATDVQEVLVQSEAVGMLYSQNMVYSDVG